MTNSMANNKGGDNSMSKLNFLWISRFKDNSEIYQIDQNGNEHRFQEVKDRFSELVYFHLSNNKDKIFTVDLINGLIYFNNYQTVEPELIKEKKNLRLIYFRRNFIDLTLTGIKNHTIIYFLGLQYTSINNENRNIILQINQNGDFIISEK